MTVTENSNITRQTEYVGNFVYDMITDTLLDYIITPEGRLAVNGGAIKFAEHEYYLTDHLGNVRAVIKEDPNNPTKSILLQENHYYPFGEEFVGLDATAGSNNYKYNRKELQEDLKLQWYDYGARMYDPAIARWHVVDPMAELDFNFSPYNYCLNNPVNLLDPDGLSTHTDSTGAVVAVYKDGDNSVYKHGEMAENYATYEGETETYTDPETGETKTREKARLSGGEKMGETENWDEFRAHDDETGKTLNKVEGKIMFGESWDYAIDLNNRAANKMDLSDVAANSLPNKIFDIKTKHTYAPYGPATGKMLNGKYATARSAGNYLAGLNGATGKFAGKSISLGTYMRLAGAVHSGINFQGAPYYGEIPYAGRMIVAGFNAGVKKRK